MSEHPKKAVTIIVEATAHEWPKDEITYSEVVTLEDPDFPQHPERVYSVTYEKAHGNKSGVLSPGGSVKVKDGMVFYAKDTGES
ncbi:multiubiquitin domain-containing protein [Ferribacterium limneticum]|uniref:multiubiquitin domain-containing protein n=1 Tax=Ferribacterium limneticum TaxID=76259 RepID=UPI001CF8D32B|nr:multiubiquitin domain-containing protein [Ferribacterium limneticum]UCV23689.1 multiubiquitin domain-containing protein [Ferribacterium limneticum]